MFGSSKKSIWSEVNFDEGFGLITLFVRIEFMPISISQDKCRVDIPTTFDIADKLRRGFDFK